MAYSKKPRKKGLEIVTPTDSEAAQDAAAATATASEPIPPIGKQGGRGKPRTESTFWTVLNAITPEQWESKRWYLYVWQIEPYSTQKIQGQTSHLMKYYEAIDSQKLMEEFGSGKYYLRLKERPPGARQDRDIESLTLDIYNPKYPPKLPRQMWEADPRNAKWLAMLPAAPPPAGETAQMFNTFLDIQERMKDQVQQPEGADPTSQLATTVEIAKNLMEMAKPKEEPKPALDPFATVKQIFDMRANDPIVGVLMQRMESMDKAAEAARQREYELQKELRQMATAKPAAEAEKPRTLLDQVKEAKEVLTTLGVPLGENGAAPVRRGGPTPLDYVQALAPLFQPVTDALGRWLAFQQMKAMQGLQPPPTQPGPVMQPNGSQPQQPNVQQAPQNVQQDFLKFINETVTPAMLHHLESDMSGEDFAAWLYDGHGAERLAMLQSITHPLLPGKSGVEVITHLYKQSPLWPRIQLHEARFNEFVKDFCAWRPEKPDSEMADTETDEQPERADV